MRTRILSLGFLPSLLVAASSSVLIGFAAPPNGFLLGCWIGFIPLIAMVRRPRVTAGQAIVLGWVGGLGIGLVGFTWLAELLVNFAGMPPWLGWLGLFGFSAWMAVPYAIWAWGMRLGQQTGMASYLWPPILFVALQYIWPNLFPYTPLLGLAEAPTWIQLVEWGGVPLLEGVVVLWAVCGARLLLSTTGFEAVRNVSALVLIPTLIAIQGAWRIRVIDRELASAPEVVVGIVQPNVPISGGTPRVRLSRLREPSRELERAGAEMVVWPEAGTYPYPLPRSLREDRSLGSSKIRSLHKIPTLLGAGTREPDREIRYNSAFLIDGGGRVRGRYDKVELVPFGEFVPLVDPAWVRELIPHISHLEPGEGPTRFDVEVASGRHVAIGPLICYEDILPGYVREVAGQPGGIDLLVNFTIDAWYGDSAEPWEHLALAQFRSVEVRLPMVRSTSTGVSAYIDAVGRVVESLPLRPVTAETLDRYPPETLLARVRLARNTADRPTPFARGGWLFAPLSVAVVLGAALMHLGRRLRAQS